MAEPFVDDPDFVLHVGDALEVLRGLPAESVHCCVTSPPYWSLRDYGTEGQLGLEATPDLYVANMVAVFREVRRVLRVDGTLWLNIGDSYAGSWGNQGRKEERGTQRPINGEMLTPVLDGRYPDKGSNTGAVPAGLKPKDLVGIPWRVAFALQADGWYLRSDIIWAKPNPMPESVTDRPTKAHEYLFLLTKSPRYFYDADAIREPAEWARWGDQTVRKGSNPDGWIKPKTKQELVGKATYDGFNGRWNEGGNPTVRNKRSVWEIATEAYPDAHFATFPQALVEPCVKACTSEHGCCGLCGAPWERRIVAVAPDGRQAEVGNGGKAYDADGKPLMGDNMFDHGTRGSFNSGGKTLERETVGWKPTCECAFPHSTNPCVVLDPFLGSGTTALVARRLGRQCIGIELNPEYAELAARRLQQQSLFACVVDESAGLKDEAHG